MRSGVSDYLKVCEILCFEVGIPVIRRCAMLIRDSSLIALGRGSYGAATRGPGGRYYLCCIWNDCIWGFEVRMAQVV